jgi:hypothetical protein
MEAFGREGEGELRTFLELPHGIPDENTFFRVFKRIKPEEPAGSLLSEAREETLSAINIDGKTYRINLHAAGLPLSYRKKSFPQRTRKGLKRKSFWRSQKIGAESPVRPL